MTMRSQLAQYGQRRLTRKLSRSLPWIGGLLALATLSAAVRRKGFFKGTLDTALDFTPIVGGVKNLAEAARGRDFLRDKTRA
jgi:Pre-toxin TG